MWTGLLKWTSCPIISSSSTNQYHPYPLSTATLAGLSSVDIPDLPGHFLVVSCVQKGGSMGYEMRPIRYKKMVLL
jgi:hypothetical protein